MSATFGETVAAMSEVLAECRRDRHRAGYFAALYLRTTKAVHTRAQAGMFEYPERMERFVASFSARYLDAHRLWRAGRPTTAAWQLAFDTASYRRPVIVQHLALGMNAHINLDLGIVVADLARHDPGGLDAWRDDFDLINRVLAEELDASQAGVDRVSPVMRIGDGLGLRHDEQLCRFTLRLARAGAWAAAQRHLASPAEGRQAEIDRSDAAVAELGRRFAYPGGMLDLGRSVVRVGELRSVPHVIDALGR